MKSLSYSPVPSNFLTGIFLVNYIYTLTFLPIHFFLSAYLDSKAYGLSEAGART